MSGPAVPLTNVGSGYTIVIAPQTGSSEAQQNVSRAAKLLKFLKGEPKAIGIVQIMIGLWMLLLGIVITVSRQQTVLVFSGIFIWGSLLYIITGSLAVSATKKLHRCVVDGALAMNVFSALTAAISISFLSLDLTNLPPRCYGNESCFLKGLSNGTAGVLLVFSTLQFIISICTAAYACRATCNSEPTVNITVVPNQEGIHSVVNPFPTQNNQQ